MYRMISARATTRAINVANKALHSRRRPVRSLAHHVANPVPATLRTPLTTVDTAFLSFAACRRSVSGSVATYAGKFFSGDVRVPASRETME